jgi:hypothetical protein
MKLILKSIWNYFIGYRNGYYPKILWEHVSQCPLKFWCSILWVYKKNNHDFAVVYIDDITDEEITYEQYINEHKEFMKLRKEWYDKQYIKKSLIYFVMLFI